MAEGGHSVVVPANDGYGLGECLAEGAPAAASWPTRGARHRATARPKSFGPADPVEVTASIAVKSPRRRAKAYAISCRN